MLPRYDYGHAVRVTRAIRNDGTFPGRDRGDLLVRRGSIGYVRGVGTFLQDQLIYEVHFLDHGLMVGCREEELIDADAPWTPSRFEFRDWVRARVALAARGEVRVAAGALGQVLKVLRDAPGAVAYHVLFTDRILQVPEGALEPEDHDDDHP